jgi:hypothetical protein
MPGSRGRRTVVVLVVGAVLALALDAAARASSTDFGHVAAPDRSLRAGCHHYRYHYVVRPGSDDWILETWLHDPRGRARGSGDFLAGSDPKVGRGWFGVCRSTVVAGRFTITARLRWYTPGTLPVDPPVEHTRWFEPAHFRLTRP